jgi:DNA-binding GntR family transcriptional regulator
VGETSAAGSSPATIRRGLSLSARARPIRWGWPPENSCGYRTAADLGSHAHIIEALEARDADAVEVRVRQHVLDLAEHVRLNVSHLK